MTLFRRYPIIILERITFNDGTLRDDSALGARRRSISTSSKLANENSLSENLKVENIDSIKNEPSELPLRCIKTEEQVTSCLISPCKEELVRSNVDVKEELHEIVPRVMIKNEIKEKEDTIHGPAHHDHSSSDYSDADTLREEVRRRRKATKTRKNSKPENCIGLGTAFDTFSNESLSDENCAGPMRGQKANPVLSKSNPRDKPSKIKELSIALVDLFPENSLKQGGISSSEKSSLCQDQFDALKIREGLERASKAQRTSNKSRSTLISNYLSISTESPYSCTHCPVKFHRKNVLQKHLLSHSDEISAQPKTRTMKVVNRERKFLCAHCDSYFFRKPGLLCHLRSIHSDEIFGVQRQGEKFSKVVGNKWKHSGVRLFSCEHCDRSFTRKYVLRIHLSSVHSTLRPFSCSYCDRTFKVKGHLTVHEKNIHLKEKRAMCPVCNKKFSSKSYLKEHSRVHNRKVVICENCLKQFSHEDHLHKHQINESCKKFFGCSECDRRFPKKSALKKHMELHFCQEKFCCAHCDKKFKDRRALKEHIELHLGGGQLSCKHCALKFIDEVGLEKHLLTNCKQLRFLGPCEISEDVDHLKNQASVTSEKKYPCLNCDKIFEGERDLADHLVRAVCSSPFSCAHCSSRFRTKRGVERHMPCHFEKISRKFTCESCGKNFPLKKTYKEHAVNGCSSRKSQDTERRSAKKQFTCAHCGSTLSDKGNLVKHMDTHKAIKDRPFSCCLCPKKFTKKEHLQNHLTSHSDLRRFQCSKCPFKFKTKVDCRKHERIHSNERRFQCKLCPSNFKRGSHLKEHHTAAHSDEKPFSCSQCPASFKLKRVLVTHIKRHDDNLKRFSCDVCLYKFHTLVELRGHVKVHTYGHKFRVRVKNENL